MNSDAATWLRLDWTDVTPEHFRRLAEDSAPGLVVVDYILSGCRKPVAEDVIKALVSVYERLVTTAAMMQQKRSIAARLLTWSVFVVLQEPRTRVSSETSPIQMDSAVLLTACMRGHRLLLSAARYFCREHLYVGISGEALLVHKKGREQLQSFAERAAAVECFIEQLGRLLDHLEPVELHILELNDFAGPAATDPSMQALIVSEETAAGAVGDKRATQGKATV
ncbi:hypothetical protein F1559_002205 [Cyanidiococcus yangmingshanensis]|uniref:Uncharacterized protein n=1 Tax=Cyanidiococcus yangmingshanensis TaxID=2690220 RepID=A0A7J7IPY5_9RHOD|nr:hypothetical protein F1559_002205 [Cyanidiococcus yangmingshanensis]